MSDPLPTGTIDGLPPVDPAVPPYKPGPGRPKSAGRDPMQDVEVPPYLPIIRVLAKALSDENLTAHFTTFEADFVGGIIRILASCKCDRLSDQQARLLLGIYAKVILINELPVPMRSRPEKK
jgi:hypothetical protein